MIENLLPLKLAPGFFANGTKYQAKGRWNEGNLVRFHEGTIQPVGGWAQRVYSGASMIGTPIAAKCWQLADGTPYLAVGTTQGLYVIDNADICYDITPVSSDMHSPPFDWDLSTFGAYLIAVNSLRGDDDLSKVNTYVWTGATSTKAAAAWTADIGPKGAYAAFVTPERFLVVVRGQDPTTHTPRSGVDSAYSERRLYWASQEELADFVSTDTNTGGDFDLQTEGRLVVGAAARGQSLIWSDVDLWTMNYIGGQLVYSFQNVGQQCGIVSKRAYVLTDKGAYWMGRGKFFIYDGFARSIPCDVTDRVFGDFNESRANMVWAMANARFNEVTWFYPSAGAQYADRYVTYNHAENHWVFGELNRTIGIPQRFRRDVVDEPKPALFNDVRLMFEHETGNERDAQAWLTSGPVELGDGDRLMRIQGVVPDDRTAGNVALRLYTAMAPDSLESLNGPYTLQAATDVRLTTRQVRVRLEEAQASDWRVGIVRLAVKPVERRGARPGPTDAVPASIEIVPTAVTLISAQHYTFQAIIRNAAGEVLDMEPDVWTSDNAAQVPIDTTGTVSALATPATAHVQARLLSPALSSNLATVSVIGDNVPASLTIAPTAFDILLTKTQTMTYEFRNAAGQVIIGLTPSSWSSSNTSAATVDSTGVVTGVGTGGITTNIQAQYVFGALTLNSNLAVATAVDPYVTHTFGPGTPYVFSDAFNVTTLGTGAVRVLLVGGGGSGGSVDGSGVAAGGGGAGGVIDTTQTLGATGAYAITIGSGGITNFADHTIGVGSASGNHGLDTTVFGLTAKGGGKGDSNDATAGGATTNGGSGGGGSSTQIDTGVPPVGTAIHITPGGTGTAGQGNSGGTGAWDPSPTGTTTFGGGGGGAGSAGSAGRPGPGYGGNGISSDISGFATIYGGGGGGGAMSGGGGAAGGTGGGGLGGQLHQGTDGLGGGGGGGSANTGNQGGRGGHGIVIVRYKVSTGIVATGGTKVVHN